MSARLLSIAFNDFVFIKSSISSRSEILNTAFIEIVPVLYIFRYFLVREFTQSFKFHHSIDKNMVKC